MGRWHEGMLLLAALAGYAEVCAAEASASGLSHAVHAGTPPACSDGLDNDGDGLRDWPVDPGCSKPTDADEGGDPPPTLSYLFNETDGRLVELNWTAAPGGSRRILWDESYRFPTPYDLRPNPPNVSGTQVWMHSASGNLMGGGTHWQTHQASDWSKVVDEVIGAPQLTAPVSVDAGAHTVVVSVESQELMVSDTFHFSGDTMYVTMNVTRKRDAAATVLIPVLLGSLQLGNLYANDSLNVNNNKMWELAPDYGGYNNTWTGKCTVSKYAHGMCATSTGTPGTYPRGAFSPIDIMADENVAMSMMYLDTIDAGEEVSFKQMIPFSGYLAGFRGSAQMSLTNKSSSLTVAFKLAAAADWQETIQPYKQFFDKTYGQVSYCPTGPFKVNAYEAGRVGAGGKNRLPKMSLYNISHPKSTAESLRGFGTNLFGVWGTALYSSWETNNGQANEFNPVTEFLDPNIAEHDDAVMAKFLTEFKDADVNVFWFQRPCSDIVNITRGPDAPGGGATWDIKKVAVEYDTSPAGFRVTQKGDFQWIHDMLGWPPNQLQRNLDRMEHWINKGVRGFYFDEAECDNMEAFLAAARSKWPDIFTVVEGSVDRRSVLSASIPIVKENGGHYYASNSLLIKWLLPEGTYYSGAIDQNLDANETMVQMLKGIGVAIPPIGSGGLQDPWCDVLDQSYKNQLEKWKSYKPKAGQRPCEQPIPRTAACKPPLKSDDQITAAATIFWATQPARPGETVMLAGSGWTAAAKVSIKTETGDSVVVAATQVSEASLKFVIPATMALDIYTVSVDGSAPYTINTPDTWWFQGDRGNSSTAGGWVRVMGRAMSLTTANGTVDVRLAELEWSLQHAVRNHDVGAVSQLSAEFAALLATPEVKKPTLHLLPQEGGGKQSTKVVATNFTQFDALFELPSNLAPGVYRLAIDNGYSGSEQISMFQDPIHYKTDLHEIVSPDTAALPTGPLYDVTQMGVVGCNTSSAGGCINATTAVVAALENCGKNGGGVVYFPRGKYIIEAPLDARNWGLDTTPGNLQAFWFYAHRPPYKDGLQVPPNCVLKGEAQELTAIWFAQDSPTTAPHAYIHYDCGGYYGAPNAGQCQGVWGIEDLTFYVTGYYRALIHTQCAARFEMRRVLVRANPYLNMDGLGRNASSYGAASGSAGHRSPPWEPQDVGYVVDVTGNNWVIEDCDLYGAGEALIRSMSPYAWGLGHAPNITFSQNKLNCSCAMPGSGAEGYFDGGAAAYGLVRRNRLYSGGNPLWLDGVRQIIVEGNDIQSASLEGGGNCITDYSWGHTGPTQHVLWSNNRLNQDWGNDREIMTFDTQMSQGCYWGPHAYISGNTVTVLNSSHTKESQNGCFWSHGGHYPLDNGGYAGRAQAAIGGDFAIVNGTGVGQVRRILNKTFDGAAGPGSIEFELDSPFDVEPDATSFVAAVAHNGHHIFTGNQFIDAGMFQFYMMGMHAIVSGNTAWRNSGFAAEVEDNHMLEGLSAESGAPAQGYGQFRGDNPRYNVKALHSKGSTNFNMFVEDKGGLGDYDFVMPSVRFVRFTRNGMHNNGGMQLGTESNCADIVVEGNMIGPGSSGIVVGRSTMPAKKNLTDSARGIYLRNNQCDESGPACPDSNHTTTARIN